MMGTESGNRSKISEHLSSRLRKMRPEETIDILVTVERSYENNLQRIIEDIKQAGIQSSSEIGNDGFVTLSVTAAEVQLVTAWIWVESMIENQTNLTQL